MAQLRLMALAALVAVLAGCGREPVVEGPPPWPEHPRPDLERAQWRNLNRGWEYEPDAESPVHRRNVAAPAEWKGKRVWLCLDAPGDEAAILVDGDEAGHKGANERFALDVTEKLAPGGQAELAVLTPEGGLPRMVWLEARPATYLDGLSLTARAAPLGWRIEAQLELAGADGAAKVEIASTDATVAAAAGQARVAGGRGSFTATLEIAGARTWTPETPNLYPLTVRVTGGDGATDEVRTYFALRTVERGKGSVLLNGKPLYVRGLLDEMEAESDDDLRRRIERTKELGFNALWTGPAARGSRLRYWADKTGILLTEGAPPDEPSSVDALGFRVQTTSRRRLREPLGYLYEPDGWPAEFGYDAFVAGMTPADLQGADFVGFEGPPMIEAEPGGKLTITPFVSHFSERTEAPTLEISLTAINDLGGRVEMQGNVRKARWESYGVTPQQPIVMSSPDIRNYTGAVTFELKDEDGKRIAANFVPIVLRGAAEVPRVEQVTPRRTALRAAPASFAASGWAAHAAEGSKLWAQGAGRAEHRFDIPAEVLAAGVTQFELLAELATRTGENGLVRVTLAGETMGEVELPDDPKDAQGMLSRDGGHGYLVRLEMTPDATFLERLRTDGALALSIEVPKERAAGLSIYGERSGRYPMDVTLTVQTERAVHRVEAR